MGFVNKSFFTENFKTRELEGVPGLGDKKVKIRELPATIRTELSVLAASEKSEGKQISVMAQNFPFIISEGMVMPKLTLAEARAIPSSRTDAFTHIASEILKLSGLSDDNDEEVPKDK